jgi:hypothetical protein
MRARLPTSVIASAAAALLLAACLPGDTRPPPAVVHLTVEPSPADTDGFTTTDGWQISFEKLLVSVGGAGFVAHGIGGRDMDDSACNDYSNAGYERLFDFTVKGRQKLSDLYGLGSCGIRVRLRAPGTDALLGEGVTPLELAFMRTSGTDAVVTNGFRTASVRGSASRGAVTKGFEWSFRLGISLHGCAAAGGVGFASDVVLAANEVVPLPVIVHAEELFRERASDDSPLRFDALGAADADGDQMITLDELAAVPGPLPEADAGLMAGDGGAETLEQFIYNELVPRMIRIGDSGACVGDPQQMGR